MSGHETSLTAQQEIERALNAAGIATDSDGPVFAEPWQAQAFAIVVGLHERGLFAWSEWAERLGAAIAADAGHSPAGEYYRLWLDAAEELACEKAGIGRDELSGRQQAWRDAAARTPHGEPIEL